MPHTTITILAAEDHYHVSVRIDGEDFDLGDYATGGEAGTRVKRWVDGRCLRLAPNSTRVLDRAQRLGSAIVTFEVITIAQYDIVTDAAAHAWVEASEGILPWPFMP